MASNLAYKCHQHLHTNIAHKCGGLVTYLGNLPTTNSFTIRYSHFTYNLFVKSNFRPKHQDKIHPYQNVRGEHQNVREEHSLWPRAIGVLDEEFYSSRTKLLRTKAFLWSLSFKLYHIKVVICGKTSRALLPLWHKCDRPGWCGLSNLTTTPKFSATNNICNSFCGAIGVHCQQVEMNAMGHRVQLQTRVGRKACNQHQCVFWLQHRLSPFHHSLFSCSCVHGENLFE